MKITAVCFVLVWGMLLALCFVPEIRESANELVLNWLPYFVFIMYTINRGRNFTRVLFMNCDHSLLTYSIYKQPKFVLKLFQIRLREIMKINAVPAIVIGAGLCLTPIRIGRYRKSCPLSGIVYLHTLHEYIFFNPLSYHLLSASAL